MAIMNCFFAIKNLIPKRTIQFGSSFGNTGSFVISISLALLSNNALFTVLIMFGATLEI